MNKHTLKICSVKSILILVLLSILLIIPASAKTYDLYPTDAPGTADYIFWSLAQPGDTLFFHGGTYDQTCLGAYFALDFNKNNITLKGDKSSPVILDPGTRMPIVCSGLIFDSFKIIPHPYEVSCIHIAFQGTDQLASDNIIENCDFSGKTKGSTFVEYDRCGSNNTLVFNQIKNNLYGISIWEAGPDNRIYLNNFKNNTNDIYQEGSSLTNPVLWHSPKPLTYNYNGKAFTGYMGNYWDKYTGVDANGDGIGDTPYNLGNVGQDDYPLMAPFENYAISESSSTPDPIANFTENVTSGKTPLTVKFDASTSQNAASYSWDFGDGSTGTGQVIEHTFNGAGTFNVNLTVANEKGTSAAGPHIITASQTSGKTYDLYPTDAPGTATDILMNQAQSGDTLFFHGGTYNISVLGSSFTELRENNITLKGDKSSPAILDTGQQFYICGSGLIFDNIRIIPQSNPLSDIEVTYSGPNIASDCIIKNCEFSGRTIKRSFVEFVQSGSNNTLVFNQIKDNLYGINIYQAGPDTRIYLNNFQNNTNDIYQARCSITNPVFWHSPEPLTYTYNGKTFTGYMGNYWDKYTGVDANGDGIGDTPYNLGVCGQDDYPLMAPFENYAISESSSTLSFEPSDTVMTGPGDKTEMKLLVDKLPKGFSSYVLTLNVTNPEVARISGVGFPAWASTNSSSETPAASVEIKASDLNKQVEAGASNVTLATIALEALGYGSTNIAVTLEGFKDDSDNPMALRTTEASLNIAESGWSEFQKDSSHSGYIFTSAPIKDPKVLWQSLTSTAQKPLGSGGINVPPVISGNKVFVTAENASVWAYNKENGDLIWHKELGGGSTQTATPAIGDGKLFVPTFEGDLYALDPETGNELWKTHVTDGSLECPITYSDHKLYIGDGLKGGSGTKYYYCYDDSGNFVWKHENTNTAGFLWSGSVVVGKYLVYPVFEGKIVCLDKDTGTVVDQVDFSKSSDVPFALADPGMFRSSVTYANGAIYTSSEKGQETGYCFKVGFNPDTGQFLDSGWAASIGFSTSTPVVYNGRVYIGHGEHGETGSMFCLSDSDGSRIWNTPVSGGVKSSPVISVENGKPYIYFTEAITDGSIYCLNPDGTLAWHYNPPADSAYTLQGAAISDGKVYYGTDNGYLYCIGQGEASNPTANFSSDKQTGSFPLTVSFKDTSVNANKFLWDFGDGNTSTEVNPVHTYTAAGSYNVTLTVQNEHGKDTKIANDYISGFKIPTTWPVKSGQSIQAAIDTASQGDIIKVYPGEYHEVLTINKALTLNGIKSPVLDASGFSGTSGVTISADGVNLSGFKITGTGEMCFAIHITAKDAMIENNLIDNCAEGLWLEGTGNTLSENNISNCWDFAAVLDNTGGNRIYQNTFINNKGRKMGGSSNHISGGAGSAFQSPEPVEYLWKGQKLTGYMGNYYDDYTGTDSNGDGIGDTAYTADKGTDQYPMMLPFSNYIEAQENAPIPDDSWYQFHGKIDHLGYSASGPKTNRTEWVSKDIDAISSTSPVTADGKVFVICGSSGMEGGTGDIPQLVALNESTGDIIWNTGIPDSVYGSWASPAYDNGMVFTATGPELGCYNAKTGEKLWNFKNTRGTQGVVNSGPAVADGMVIFNDWDGSYYYCLDEYTGDLLWSFKVEGDAQSVPVYSDGKFYLTSWKYGTTNPGHAYCVDAVTGEQVWHISIDQNFCGSPAYKDGVLYLTTYNFYGSGEIVALNTKDGSSIWQQNITSTDTTPALAYGNIYVCGGASGYSSAKTYCFNATTGAPVWSTQNSTAAGDWTCSASVGNGLVYVGSTGEDGYFGFVNLYALDAFTGNVVWHAPYAGSSPALSDGMLFSIGGDQKVYAFKDSSIPPVANFTATPTTGDAPSTVSFTDISTNFPTSWAWDFDNDGTVDSTDQNPTHIYAAAGNYTVNLTVRNLVGSNSIVKTNYISVSESSTPTEPAPVAAFTADVTSGTAPFTVNFTDQSTGSPTSWNWEFGDGAKATEQNTSHTYATAGIYTVNLTVSNANSTNSTSALITVSEKPIAILPVANFSTNVSEGYAPLSVQFTDLSENSTSWNWDFGDGTNSIQQNDIHTYTTAGIYTINLTAVNANGTNSKSTTITVSETPATILPVANFSTNVSEGYAPLSVQFSDLSENAISWNWDFGDGNNATEQNPVHIYTSAGIYIVNLTVNNSNGTNSASVSINVSEKTAPVLPMANFSTNVSEGYVPLSIQFTGLSENATSLSWDFGDGSNSTEQNPMHTYTAVGNYSVNLTVSNENGTSSRLAMINVLKQPSRVPVANFSSDVTEGTVPLSVQFSDLSKDATGWNWDFGDGATSTEQNPVHIYNAVGKYAVKLTASNEAGTDVETKTGYITVKAVSSKLAAAFTASPTSGNAPLKVVFTDKSTGSPTSRKWSFGDGTSSTEKNPVHTYSKAGKYTVSLTVKNAKGSSTVKKSGYINAVTILKAPVAAFSAFSTFGNAPLKVVFNDWSRGSPTSWNWNFGDGTSSTEKSPVHTYSKAGKYTVSLTVKNSVGKSTVTGFNYIKVAAPLKPPVADFSASPTSGNSPLEVGFTDKSAGSPTSWKWSFGDGTYSTAKNPAHTYSKAGKYTVSLTVKNAAGSSVITKPNYINVITLKAPTAAFSALPTSGKAPLKVTFADKSTESPTSWKWSFGDGTYSAARNPVHTYSKAGKYTVTLIVKNAGGSNTKTMYGYITVSKK